MPTLFQQNLTINPLYRFVPVQLPPAMQETLQSLNISQSVWYLWSNHNGDHSDRLAEIFSRLSELASAVNHTAITNQIASPAFTASFQETSNTSISVADQSTDLYPLLRIWLQPLLINNYLDIALPALLLGILLGIVDKICQQLIGWNQTSTPTLTENRDLPQKILSKLFAQLLRIILFNKMLGLFLLDRTSSTYSSWSNLFHIFFPLLLLRFFHTIFSILPNNPIILRFISSASIVSGWLAFFFPASAVNGKTLFDAFNYGIGMHTGHLIGKRLWKTLMWTENLPTSTHLIPEAEVSRQIRRRR